MRDEGGEMRLNYIYDFNNFNNNSFVRKGCCKLRVIMIWDLGFGIGIRMGKLLCTVHMEYQVSYVCDRWGQAGERVWVEEVEEVMEVGMKLGVFAILGILWSTDHRLFFYCSRR